jgi:hypothetical protein
MVNETFRLELDFEQLVLEDWEKKVLEAYAIVLQDKVNRVGQTLSGIAAEIGERTEVPVEAKQHMQLEICDAIQTLYGWGSASLADFEQVLRSLSSQAKGLAQRAIRRTIEWLIGKLIEFFSRVKQALRVQGWSVGGGPNIPFGLSVNISVTFEV